VDSWRHHGGRGVFETDRSWILDLVSAGYRVIRVTTRQIDREPLAVIAGIARALAL
jgi:very-short-patch-repair endonuclease